MQQLINMVHHINRILLIELIDWEHNLLDAENIWQNPKLLYDLKYIHQNRNKQYIY